ncbi:protein kinase [Actinomycetospora sp. TBRC 11914]|uniref:protein kinase n=1 Tax=Actinomycetospora sp. TBRC 11914 TaxID=2729387 RepID=UPI00145E55BE|nr:protein kinase [Actinomycetospora sp. TBRC 11914]NMO88696.1 hypothetical protein [Actinomycetospora sp. TBRC 11914]
MTSQAPVEKTRSTPDGDALPVPRTESAEAITASAITDDASDAPTGALTIGAADDAVRGVDEVLGREVRLVTLPPATGDVLSERIEQVRHLARLHHPHLLEVYDVDGLAPDTESTLVLENVPGEPLALVLREGPIAESDLARMGAQLASALAHAHAHGVEHGAIGAASILVDRAHADAWLVGLTASLSGPLPVVGEDPDDDGEDAARRRAADVRALAAILTEVVEHAAAAVGGDDPEAVTRPTQRDDATASPLAALLRDVEAEPPSAAVLSEQLVRVGRGAAVREGRAAPARLVPVVASWSESPAASDEPTECVVPPALAARPARRPRGRAGTAPPAAPGAAGRRARRAGVLGAATATLALASGLVIWAGESHFVRQDAQAEIGASAPSAVPASPLLPQATDAGTSSGGGGTWTGETGETGGASGGSRLTAVGVASRAAVRSEAPPPSTTDRSSSEESSDQPSASPPPVSRTPRPTTDPTQPTTDPTHPTTRSTTTQPTTTTPTSTARRTTTTPPTSSSTATSTSSAASRSSSSTGTTATGTTSTGTTSTEAQAAAATTTTAPPTTTPATAQTVLAAGS